MIIQGNDPYTQASFSLRNRVARALWGVVWLLLFRTSLRPMHGWRRRLLRLFGARLGAHVNIHASVRIWAPWQLTVGNRVGVANGVILYNMAPLVIGDGCVISQGAHLCGGSHDLDSPNFQLVAKPITLQNNDWVCADAFEGMGVTQAEGCELAARSVGVRVTLAQRIVYVVSAGGCGAAGAILIISQLNVVASAVFNVSWSAKMIFIALIGGLGSIEGPIVGTALYTIIQQTLAQFGAWYLILLGAVAVVVAMYLPRGIWGVIGDRFHLQIFPVGYWLHR